jgi:hypothetical protein
MLFLRRRWSPSFKELRDRTLEAINELEQARARQSLFSIPHARSTVFTSHLGEGYNPCLLLLFDSGKEDLFETIGEKASEKGTIFEKNEKSRKMETWKE